LNHAPIVVAYVRRRHGERQKLESLEAEATGYNRQREGLAKRRFPVKQFSRRPSELRWRRKGGTRAAGRHRAARPLSVRRLEELSIPLLRQRSLTCRVSSMNRSSSP